MAAAGARVVGIDFSPGMLAKLRAKPGADAMRLVRHDLATGLPLASGSMDRVTCGGRA
jgi:ubiquinone/menaquinone biosynthesis C-methylase UbiE